MANANQFFESIHSAVVKRPNFFKNPIISAGLLLGPLIYTQAKKYVPSKYIKPSTLTPDFQQEYGEKMYGKVSKEGPLLNDTVQRPKMRFIPSNPNLTGIPILISVIDTEFWAQYGKTLSTVRLDFIPTNIRVQHSSSFNPIKVIGSNNLPLQYGGSEDTIIIKVDWYGYQNSDVLSKCLFFERLLKSDGWDSSPPLVEINWQGSDLLWGKFQIIKAPYRLMHFSRTRQHPIPAGDIRDVNYRLRPVRAEQTITLKRVSQKQLRYSDMGSEYLNTINRDHV